MNPISLSCPLSAKRTASQRNVASVFPLAGEIVEGQDAGGEQRAEAGERHGGQVQFQGPREDPPRDHEREGHGDDFFVPAHRTQDPSASRAAAGAPGVSFTSGGKIL